MKKLLILTCLAAVLFVSFSGASAKQCPLLLARSGDNTTGCYVVMFKQATSHEKMMEVVRATQHACADSKVYGMVERVVKAFTMRLSRTALNAVRVA